MSNLVSYTTKGGKHTIKDIFIAYSFVPSGKQKNKYISGKDFAHWMIYEGGEGGDDKELGTFTPETMYDKVFSMTGASVASTRQAQVEQLFNKTESMLKAFRDQEFEREKQFYKDCGIAVGSNNDPKAISAAFNAFQKKLNQKKTQNEGSIKWWVGYFSKFLIGSYVRKSAKTIQGPYNKLLSRIDQEARMKAIPNFSIEKVNEALQKIGKKYFDSNENRYSSYEKMIKAADLDFIDAALKQLKKENANFAWIDEFWSSMIPTFTNSKGQQQKIIYSRGQSSSIAIENLEMERTNSLSVMEAAKQINDAMWQHFNKAIDDDVQMKEKWKVCPFQAEVKTMYLNLWKKYLSTFKKLNKFFETDTATLGTFGEFYFFLEGDLYIKEIMKENFNQQNENVLIEIYNTGGLHNLSNQQLSYDSIIRVTTKNGIHNYGVQSKNHFDPFLYGTQVEYDKKYSIMSEELYKNYLNGPGDEFKECFQQINFNINNLNSPEGIANEIVAFLLAYLPNFWRLASQEVQSDEVNLIFNEVEMKKIIDKSREELFKGVKDASNIFFYIGRTIIPVSYILTSLLAAIQELKKNMNKISTSELLNYENKVVRKNVRSTKDGFNKIRLAKDENFKNLVTINPKLKISMRGIDLWEVNK